MEEERVAAKSMQGLEARKERDQMELGERRAARREKPARKWKGMENKGRGRREKQSAAKETAETSAARFGSRIEGKASGAASPGEQEGQGRNTKKAENGWRIREEERETVKRQKHPLQFESKKQREKRNQMDLGSEGMQEERN